MISSGLFVLPGLAYAEAGPSIVVSYGGLLKVASVAEEIRNPARTAPLAMILSLVFTALLYMAVVFVTTGVLSPDLLSGSETPISDGAAAFMGQPGRILLSVAAILAFTSTANAGLMAASRYPLALSRDGLLPAHLARVNERFKTPHVAIIITGLLMGGVVFFDLVLIAKAASSVLILTYLFSCLSVIIMRESRLQNYQPRFHSPMYPWVQIAGVVGFVALLIGMGPSLLLVSCALIVAALFVYWFYSRIRESREFALLHLVERITAKELVDGSLEAELKEIIRERDDIVRDRFDHIVEECVVLDVEGPMTSNEFFELAAGRLSEKVRISALILRDLLMNRERESSTVISPGLAIPHVIINGEAKFDVLLARCRGGITFAEGAPPVHTVFVLAGTRDERNFHLRALSAIAQIVQDPHFEKRWTAAKDDQSLRDVILLGERTRHG